MVTGAPGVSGSSAYALHVVCRFYVEGLDRVQAEKQQAVVKLKADLSAR